MVTTIKTVLYIKTDKGDIIMGLLDFLKKSKKNDVKLNSNINIIFSEDHFEHTLNMVMSFLDAYSNVSQGEWCCLFISQEFEHSGNTTYGYLKFQIMLSYWWDGLLRQYPEIDDYMKNIFTFDSNETAFTYTDFRTGSSIGVPFPQEKINTLLQTYLNNYEAKYPTVKFERHSWGAKLTKNL